MLKPTLCFALAMLMLAGCQSTAPVSPLTAQQKLDRQKATSMFKTRFSHILKRAGDLANTQGRNGAFNLVVTINDKNEVVRCETQSNTYIPVPALAYNSRLARDLASICWTAVLPTVPDFLFDPEEKSLRIVAPVMVLPLTDLSPDAQKSREAKLLEKAQNNALFDHLLAPLPIDSIGIATLVVMSDSAGRVQECAASLDPHGLRPQNFKQDDALLGGLIKRCKQLDMTTLPGFKPNAQGMSSLVVQMEYTPWKAGLPSDSNKSAH